MNELTEEVEALHAILTDIATLWPANAGYPYDGGSALNVALLVRDCVRADREALTNRALLGNVGTLATTALRMIFTEADTQASMDVEAGVLQPQTAVRMFQIIRDVVKPFNEQLAEQLVTPKTEKARVRE